MISAKRQEMITIDAYSGLQLFSEDIYSGQPQAIHVYDAIKKRTTQGKHLNNNRLGVVETIYNKSLNVKCNLKHKSIRYPMIFTKIVNFMNLGPRGSDAMVCSYSSYSIHSLLYTSCDRSDKSRVR